MYAGSQVKSMHWTQYSRRDTTFASVAGFVDRTAGTSATRPLKVRAARKKAPYLLFTPWPVIAGTGVNNVLLGLSDAAAQFYEPVIVTTSWAAPPDGQVQCKLPTPTRPLRNLLGFVLSFVPNLLKLCKMTHGAAAVNAHYPDVQYMPLAFLRMLRLSPPLIFSVHGTDVMEMLASKGLKRALRRWMLSQCDVIVACSHALASRVAELKPKAKIVSVWNAVNCPPRARYARPHANRYLICIASFSFNKGHDILLRAFESVSKSYPDLDLVLIGNDAPQREAVLADIQRRGLDQKVRVHINLPHDDVWPWVQNAECLILSSRNEGLGICLLEAAMVKTPVVATAVGGVPEIVGDGERGLLCPSENPDKLAEAIVETLSKPQEAAARARRFYEFARGLTWDDAIERYRAFANLG